MTRSPTDSRVSVQAVRSPRWALAIEVAEGAAIAHAADVDSRSRFPSEAIAALRERGLLSAVAETEGPQPSSLRELVAIAETLGHGCAATAMIWAMHQIQLACLMRHGHSPFL